MVDLERPENLRGGFMQDAVHSEHLRKKHYHSFFNRGLYTLLLVSGVLFIGTMGMHFFEHFSYLDSFYFTSMIATGQGPAPNAVPVTAGGKIFTCFLAFISVGSMVASFGFLFGPFFGKLWRVGIVKLEDEIEHLRKHPDQKK